MTSRLLFVALGVICSLFASAHGAEVRTDKQNLNVVKLVSGLDHPWCIAWLPDGRMLITERAARLRMVSKDWKLDPKPIEGLPRIAVEGQGGLFDVALHPRYSENGWIYLSYNAPGPGGTMGTELMRAKLDGYRLVEQQTLFRLEPKTRPDFHFGGRIVFGGKGHVFLTLGERGGRMAAQRVDGTIGATVRLNDDGSIPKDNPFVGRKDAKPEIYTYGHRNQQGAALNPKTGELWTHEHGPQGGDEVNILRPGRNYGWPVITYGVEYGSGTKIGEGTHKAGMEQPIHYWVPSIAPSGMAFYGGDKYPGWRGNVFVGSLKFELLVRLELDGDKVVKEERMLQNAIGRIRDVRVAPDGYIYLLSDERNGVLARLEPAK